MEWYHIYLFTRLDNLHIVMSIIVLMCMVASVIAGFAWFFNTCYGDVDPAVVLSKKVLFRTTVCGLLLLVILVIIPTQKEAAAIYLLPKLAKSDFVKEAEQIPSEITKLLRLKLEAWVTDLEPKKK